MTPLLHILIPTIHERKLQFNKLMRRLYQEMQQTAPYPSIVVGWEVDNKEMTIGEKRQRLYQKSEGLYSLQIDDDDDLAPGSLVKILEAIKQGPDCVTYLEYCSMNGKSYLADHSINYPGWADNQFGYDFVRTPYFKDVIRTDIAQSVTVPFSRYGEDHEWSKALKPHLRNEIHLQEIIYLYQHNSKPQDHLKRYGYDKDRHAH